jgi:two-component system, chemotaxis family, response regulator Rcp1
MAFQSVENKKRAARILLVEDNRGDVMLVKEVFKQTKIASDITVAMDGKTALSILSNIEKPVPDIILLDLNLPGINGKQVLKTIKTDARLKHIPVMMLSSSRAEQDVTDCYDMHANCYMVKAQSLDALHEMANTLEQFWFRHVVLSEPRPNHNHAP